MRKAEGLEESSNSVKDKRSDEPSYIRQMIDADCDQYMTKRTFEKAQYHQCIPNPAKRHEMVTV